MSWQTKLRAMIHGRYGAKRFIAQHMSVSESTVGRWAYNDDTPPRHKVNETVGRLALALTDLTGKPVLAKWLLDDRDKSTDPPALDPVSDFHRVLVPEEQRTLARLLNDPEFVALACELATVYDRARQGPAGSAQTPLPARSAPK